MESRHGRYSALRRAASHFRERVMLLRASKRLPPLPPQPPLPPLLPLPPPRPAAWQQHRAHRSAFRPCVVLPHQAPVAASATQPCLRTQARRLCALSSPPPSDTAAPSEHVPHAFVCAVRSPHLYVRHRCLSEHVPRARVCPLAGGHVTSTTGQWPRVKFPPRPP